MSSLRRPPPTSPDNPRLVEMTMTLRQQLEIPKLNVREVRWSNIVPLGRSAVPIPSDWCFFFLRPYDRHACTNDGQADPRRVATSDRLINSLPETVETISGSQTGSLHRASNFSGAVIVRDHCRDSEDKLGVANRSTPNNSCIRRWKSTLQALPEESDA